METHPESDEAETAALRLSAALDRIAAHGTEPARPDPRVTAKLDNLIRALRSALDS